MIINTKYVHVFVKERKKERKKEKKKERKKERMKFQPFTQQILFISFYSIQSNSLFALRSKCCWCFGKVVQTMQWSILIRNIKRSDKWTASSEFGTYRLCEQRRFRRACASAQSRQNLRCSLIQAVSQEEPSDRKPDPWPLWMAGHAQLNLVMTECSKTQIRLTGLK